MASFTCNSEMETLASVYDPPAPEREESLTGIRFPTAQQFLCAGADFGFALRECNTTHFDSNENGTSPERGLLRVGVELSLSSTATKLIPLTVRSVFFFSTLFVSSAETSPDGCIAVCFNDKCIFIIIMRCC